MKLYKPTFITVLPLALLFASAASLFGQNPRSVLSSHPRLILNDTIPDTWQPGQTRLSAVVQRVTGGGATQAAADFGVLKSGLTSTTPDFGNSSNEDANLNLLLNYALAYQIYHKAKQDNLANSYAAAAWAGMTAMSQPVYYVTSIVTDSAGNATATLSAPANPPIGLGSYALAVWGAGNDLLNGPITVASVPTATTFTYPTPVPNVSVTSSGMLASASWTGATPQGSSARQLSQWAYFYDWCYDWLVANGHDQYARDQIKAGYWSNTLTRQSTQWSDQVREADFHNYTALSETAILEAGLALFGEDPLAGAILDEGAGYLWEGVSVQPADCCSDAYEYNVKKSIDTLTGGAMNWEGPTYWRAGTIRFLRAIEAYDSATGRRNNLWVSQFRTVKNAGMYKVYLRDPSGQMANFGDGGNSNSFAGRDNFGMAILDDRFPDAHFVWMMTNSPNDWNSGDSGETGLVYKLLFFPYVNGPGSHDPSDLPLGAQFGPDIILRTGWGPGDTFITYSGSIKGTYHRHDDAGTFTIYRNNSLVLGQPYTLVDPTYSNYNRRTIGGNTLTIYDPGDCWKDNAATCGIDVYGNYLANDGGQLRTLRRYRDQFDSDEFQISRAWSGSLYSDGRYSSVYSVFDSLSQPVLLLGNGYEHVRHDLTGSYVNSYAGAGDNPQVKASTANGVNRELVHFQPVNGSAGALVVYDRVSATDPGFQKSWLLHTVNAPAVDGVPALPGDTSFKGGTQVQTDNGGGRLFLSRVLPADATVRTVGGNACKAIPIQGATNANPAVFYAPSHGLQAGEWVGLATGTQPETGAGPVYWPNWLLDRYFAIHAVASVPDPDHFTLSPGYGADSTGYAAWSTAFSSGTGAPTGTGAFAGQVYYQTDGANGNTVWQWTGSAWANLVGAGWASPTGYTSPVVYSHSNCNWSYFVDQFGPPGSGPAHLWNPSMDYGAASVRPNWQVSISPPTGNLTDYFLNVLSATNTDAAAPPATTLITSGSPAIQSGQAAGNTPQSTPPTQSSVYGVQIVDGGAVYVAVFSRLPVRTTILAYSTQHGGMALHVAADLARGKYVVLQNGEVLGTYLAAEDGSISFREWGGGDFRILPDGEASSPSSADGAPLR